MARPTTFNSNIADAVIAAVARGVTIQAACDAADVRRTTFLKWARAGRGRLKRRLALAKVGQSGQAERATSPFTPPPVEESRHLVLRCDLHQHSRIRSCDSAVLSGARGRTRKRNEEKAAPVSTGNPRGRPSRFDFEEASRIIARMEEGQDIRSASRAEGIAVSTFRGWAARDVGGIAESFERAQGVLALFRQCEAEQIAEAGGREKEIRWRLAFADRWLPRHLRPGGN